MAAINRGRGQGVVHGAGSLAGGYQTRDQLSRPASLQGVDAPAISQRDLASHLAGLSSVPAARLDGEEWAPLAVAEDAPVEGRYELTCGVRKTQVVEIEVRRACARREEGEGRLRRGELRRVGEERIQ